MMARAGDVIDLPQLGERFVFHRTAEETGGEELLVEQVIRPGRLKGLATFAHVHSRQAERHALLAGRLGMRVGRRRLTLRPGDEVDVPPGVAHRLFAVDDGEIRLLLGIRPALKTQMAFEALGRLTRAGKVNRWGAPSPLQFAVLADEYRDENRLAWPPRAVQEPLVRLVAGIGRWRGYGVPGNGA